MPKNNNGSISTLTTSIIIAMLPSSKDITFLMISTLLMAQHIFIFAARLNAKVFLTHLGLHPLPVKQKELFLLWNTDIMENLCLSVTIQ